MNIDHQLLKKKAKSFYFASIFLPKKSFKNCNILYNFCREVDDIAKTLVESGVAVWEDRGEANERLIVRGRSNLLESDAQQDDIELIRKLFDDLERKQDIASFLELTEEGQGVRIFIGSENKLFSLSGSSLVVSSYMNADHKVIGAIGVIGPKRLNYGRIVPIVDYTAQLVGKLISKRT